MKYLNKNYLNLFLVIILLTGMFWIGYQYHRFLYKQEPTPSSALLKQPEITAPKNYLKNDSLLDIKLARDRERSREQERIQDILDKIGVSDDIRQQAEKELWRLTQATTKEAELENLLKANGFENCFVAMNNGLITVVVNRILQTEEVKSIGRFTAEVTGLSLDKIQIVERP